jgi:hypothetical protein
MRRMMAKRDVNIKFAGGVKWLLYNGKAVWMI